MTEIVFSLSLIFLLGFICTTVSIRLCNNLCYAKETILLDDASRYMFSILEKNLAYDARSIKITSKGVIKYNTIYGNKNIIIYLDNRKLYQKTITGTGIGVNPLFLENILISNWQVINKFDKYLLIKMTLYYGRHKKEFSKFIPCWNAVISNE